MLACSFFGHRNINYTKYSAKIKKIIIDLIVNYNVSVFYNGYRGNFDTLCAYIVWELKSTYNIHNTMILSYMPCNNKKNKFILPKYFDDSIYLLEKPIPAKFAISQTNRLIVQKCYYIISGVNRHFGGADTACEYAKSQKKKLFRKIGYFIAILSLVIIIVNISLLRRIDGDTTRTNIYYACIYGYVIALNI